MIQVDIDIHAPKSYVWECLLHKTSMWWPREFHTSPFTRKMVFDDFLGGRLYEDFGNNEGIIWTDIITIKSPDYITMRGQLSPEFGGPNISFNRIELEKITDESCKFHFREDWIVEKDEKFLKEMKDGWITIFSGLKEMIEKR